MQVTDQDVQGAEDRVAALRQQINDRELADATARRESENEQKLAALEAEEARLQTQLDAMTPAASAPSASTPPVAQDAPVASAAGSSSTPPSSDAPPVPPTPAGSSPSASPAGTTDNGGK